MRDVSTTDGRYGQILRGGTIGIARWTVDVYSSPGRSQAVPLTRSVYAYTYKHACVVHTHFHPSVPSVEAGNHESVRVLLGK